jgi:hypothetical protein
LPLQAALLETAAVLTAATALCVYLTWPLSLHLGDRIFGLGGDSFGAIWWLWFLGEGEGYDVLGANDMTTVGAPFGWEQGNAPALQIALPFVPAYLVSTIAGEVAAYNLVVLSGLILSGAAMYLLVRRLDVSRLVAAWAGLVYVIFPWHLEKAQGHAAFTHLEGFPLLLLAVLAWHRRPDLRRAALVAGATGILWLTAGYFGVIASVGLAVLLPIAALSHRRRWNGRRALGRLAVVSSGVAATALAMFVAVRAGGGETGVAPARNITDLDAYGARLWEFVLPSYRNIVFGDDVGPWLGARLHGSNFSETSLYVGWITIVLALGWIAWTLFRRRRLLDDRAFLTRSLPAVAVVAVVFSLPSPLGDTAAPAPSRLVWEVVPQFRVPSRFVVLLMTALLPLAALALEGVRRRLEVAGGSISGRMLALGAVGIAIFASFVELSIVPPATITDVSEVPAEYRILQTAPAGAVAEYPMVASDQGLTSTYLLWQREHGRPLLNGAPPGTFSDGVRQTVVDPSRPGTASSLASLGVSAVVLHPDFPPAAGVPGAPARLGSGFRLLGRTPGGASVWRVVAQPAPAIAVFARGFLGVEAAPGGPPGRWLGSARGSVEIYARRAGRYLAVVPVGSYARPRMLRIRGAGRARTVNVPPGGSTVELPVRLPAGRSRLEIAVNPGPELLPDGRKVSLYALDWEFRPLRRSSSPRPVAAIAGDG